MTESLVTLRELPVVKTILWDTSVDHLFPFLLNSRRKDVFAMADFLAAELESLGATVDKKPLGKQVLDGVELELPPALLAQLGNDPAKVSREPMSYTLTVSILNYFWLRSRKLSSCTDTLTFSPPS
jgi:hypothetical protein